MCYIWYVCEGVCCNYYARYYETRRYGTVVAAYSNYATRVLTSLFDSGGEVWLLLSVTHMHAYYYIRRGTLHNIANATSIQGHTRRYIEHIYIITKFLQAAWLAGSAPGAWSGV